MPTKNGQPTVGDKVKFIFREEGTNEGKVVDQWGLFLRIELPSGNTIERHLNEATLIPEENDEAHSK